MPARSSVPKKSDITARDGHELDPLDQFVKSRVFTGILFSLLGVLLATFVGCLCDGRKVRVAMPKSYGTLLFREAGCFLVGMEEWRSARVISVSAVGD